MISLTRYPCLYWVLMGHLEFDSVPLWRWISKISKIVLITICWSKGNDSYGWTYILAILVIHCMTFLAAKKVEFRAFLLFLSSKKENWLFFGRQKNKNCSKLYFFGQQKVMQFFACILKHPKLGFWLLSRERIDLESSFRGVRCHFIISTWQIRNSWFWGKSRIYRCLQVVWFWWSRVGHVWI